MEKVVKRIKKFQIIKGSENYKKLDDLCMKSRNMYNYTLFILRNLNFASFPTNGHDSEYYLNQIPMEVRNHIETTTKNIKLKDGSDKTVTYYNIVVHSESNPNGKVTDEKALFTIFLKMNQFDYKAIQVSGARNAVKLAVKNMKAYKGGLIAYKKDNSKPKPELPRYKKGDGERIPFVIDNFKTDKKDKSITINGDVKINNVYVDDDVKVKQIRVIPKSTMNVFEVEVVYEKTISIGNIGDEVMAIDIGINNIAAITMTNGKTLLINGRAIKNINNFYNKEIAKISNIYSKYNIKTGKKRKCIERKRYNKIRTFIHQTSSMIIGVALKNKCGKIVIGHNDGWKQNVNIGKRNNQNFVQIPFNDLISQIEYKGEENGIEVNIINEAYTSKCSALDNEEICKHETYKGKRGGRHNKEFITCGGKLINADINGSLNILRLGTKRNIECTSISMLTPPKFNKVGKEKYCEMQPQNQSKKYKDMACNASEMENYIKVEATVDSHNVEKSTFKK